MKKINHTEMKKIEIDILKKINKICNDNNIKIYLGGGTLLGAIRHKGFIPWDDDIDLMLLREDYQKLLKIFDNNIIDDLKLLSYHNDSSYYYPFAKIININTVMYENEMKPINNLGIYIDIFPIDYLPTNKLVIEWIFFKKRIFQSISAFSSVKNILSHTSNPIKKLYKKLFQGIFSKLPKNYCARKIDKLLIKNKKTKNVVCISGSYVKKEIMPASYISDSVEVEFEGSMYLAPIGYHDYLVKHYGVNYMQIPPKEKQISNHNNVAYWK